MKIEDIDPTRQYLGGEESDPQKVAEAIEEVVVCSYKPDLATFSDGECLDLIIDIIRLPGDDATDEQCLEMIDTVVGAWKTINLR